MCYTELLPDQTSCLQKLYSFKERLHLKNNDETPIKYIKFQVCMERIKIQWMRHLKKKKKMVQYSGIFSYKRQTLLHTQYHC